MNIKHKIINLDNRDNRDYHMHSMNYSDWLNTIEEIVKFAWEIWLTEIAITDHSDSAMDALTKKFSVSKNSFRYTTKMWKNVHNDVKIIFWVEVDILNENWDICDKIQWFDSEFVNLSAHIDVYEWSLYSINKAYRNAIEKHHKIIKCIWHPCSISNFWEVVDIVELINLANSYWIPLEINGKYLRNWTDKLDKLHILLKNADKMYINSDAHTLYDLKENRKYAINFLKENNYI